MPSPFPNAGESEEDAAKRFSREAAEVAPGWMSKQAVVIEIKHGTGHMVSFARGSDDGKTRLAGVAGDALDSGPQRLK